MAPREPGPVEVYENLLQSVICAFESDETLTLDELVDRMPPRFWRMADKGTPLMVNPPEDRPHMLRALLEHHELLPTYRRVDFVTRLLEEFGPETI